MLVNIEEERERQRGEKMKSTEIPQFTREDFLETARPYKFIKENSTNHLEETQLITMVREIALSVGVTNFTSLYKAYLTIYVTGR